MTAPRIGIAGITGQVGRLLTEEVKLAGLPLSGGTWRPASGKTAPADVPLFEDIGALAEVSDAVVDFTHASLMVSIGEALSQHSAAWICGTSGVEAPQQAALEAAARHIPVVYASTFGPSSALMPELISILARALPKDDFDVEILETHHRHKVDAPSGTAVTLGRLIAACRGQVFDEVAVLGRDGDIGPRVPGSIGFGAIRGGEIVGETTINFFGTDEDVIIQRRALNRRTYATGALMAARWAVGKPPGLYSLRDVLGG